MDELAETSTSLREARTKIDAMGQQVDAAAASSADAVAKQEEALAELGKTVAQLEQANKDIAGLRRQLTNLRDARVRALEGDLAEAKRVAIEIRKKATHLGGSVANYIWDLRSDHKNLHDAALHDLRTTSGEIVGFVDTITKLDI